MNLKKFLLTLSVSILLFLLGVIFYIDLLNLLLPKFDCVLYVWNGLSDEFRNALFFGFTLSIIPFGLLYVWNLTKTISKLSKLKSVLILVFFILLAMAVSYFIVYSNLELRCKLIKSTGINVSVDLTEIQYWLYVLCGALIGLLANYFYLKNNKS